MVRDDDNEVLTSGQYLKSSQFSHDSTIAWVRAASKCETYPSKNE